MLDIIARPLLYLEPTSPFEGPNSKQYRDGDAFSIYRWIDRPPFKLEYMLCSQSLYGIIRLPNLLQQLSPGSDVRGKVWMEPAVHELDKSIATKEDISIRGGATFNRNERSLPPSISFFCTV